VEIVPGVYGVDFQGRVWAYLYRRQARFTLIDAGIAGQVDAIEAAVSEAGGSLSGISQIVLTHFHQDHAGAAAELQ